MIYLIPILASLLLLFFYEFVIFWFFLFILTCVVVLTSFNVIIMSLIIVLIYVGVVGVLIIASLIATGSGGAQQTKNTTAPSWLLFFLVGLVFILFSQFSGFLRLQHQPQSVFLCMSEQILLQKYLFFSPDLLSFFILFDGFCWVLILAGVFLLVAAVLCSLILSAI